MNAPGSGLAGDVGGEIRVQPGGDLGQAADEIAIERRNNVRDFLALHRLTVRIEVRPDGLGGLPVKQLELHGHKGSGARRRQPLRNRTASLAAQTGLATVLPRSATD